MINNINNIILELDSLSAAIVEIDLLLSKTEEGNEVQIESKFTELFQVYKCNPLIINRFLTYLQINNSTSIKKYNLSDIKLIFDKSCKVYTDTFELNLERYFFYFNILDEENLAIKELNSFIEKINDSEKEGIIKIELNINESI